MTSLASREMTEQEMINTCTAPQMAHLIQVLRQTIRNKDKEIEKWVDMVSQLQRDGELDPPEPKPLLADAKVGWICEQRNGLYSQIKAFGDSWGTDDCLNPNLFTVFLADNTTRNIYGTYLGTMVNPLPNDIISVEPLAEEGSAEWAWQMLKLGKPVTNKWVFTAGGYIKDTDSDKYRFVQMWDLFSDWQLYEEKPEPEYKVGDWVEFNPGNNPKQVEIVEIDGDKLYYNTRYAGKTIKTHIYASAITRKLDPSEVKVTLTLEGTVSRDYNETLDSFILNHTDGHTRNCIKYSTIDPDTAAMVRELLAAQEENNG